MHADAGREIRNGLEQTGPRARGERQAILRYQAGDAHLVRGEPGDFDAVPHARADQPRVVGAPRVRLQCNAHAVAGFLVNAQLGLHPDDVDGAAIGVEDMRVPGQRVQSAGANAVFGTVPGLVPADGGCGGAVGVGQVFHFVGLLGQPPQGDLAALAPAAPARAPLLADRHLYIVFVVQNLPYQPLLHGRSGPLAGLLAADFECQLLEFLERTFPGVRGDDVVEQGLRSQCRVQGVRIRQVGCDCPVPADLAGQRGALRRHPPVAVLRRPPGAALHPRPPRIAVARLVVRFSLEVRQSVHYRLDPRFAAKRALKLPACPKEPNRIDQIQFRDAIDAQPVGVLHESADLRAGLGRVDSRQAQKRKHERPDIRKEDLLARAATFGLDGVVDERQRGPVVAPQGGDHGPRRSQARSGRLAVCPVRGQR